MTPPSTHQQTRRAPAHVAPTYPHAPNTWHHQHARQHWDDYHAGRDPRLPWRLDPLERADLHHELDRILRGCAWCAAERIRALGDRVAALQAHHQSTTTVVEDQAAA